MPNILKFETRSGPQKGILTIYMLHSLKKKPKSGYELISEIKEKTQGTWVPSKGTIYPLLKQLEKGGFIKIKAKDKRSKNIFEITSSGKKMILNAKKQGDDMMKKFMRFRNLIVDVMDYDNEILTTMMNIQNTVFVSSKERKYEILKILGRCASDLKKEAC